MITNNNKERRNRKHELEYCEFPGRIRSRLASPIIVCDETGIVGLFELQSLGVFWVATAAGVVRPVFGYCTVL